LPAQAHAIVAGHPRFISFCETKTWMAGSSPAMTAVSVARLDTVIASASEAIHVAAK
jgi:hypothetical protein